MVCKNKKYLIGDREEVLLVENLIKNISIETYESIIMNSPDAIFLLDINGKIKDVNEAVKNIFGFSIADIKDIDYQQVFLPNAEYDFQQLFDQTLHGNSIVYDAKARHKDGHTLHFKVKYIPLIENKRVNGIMIIADDITEIFCTKKQLQIATAKLKSLLNSSADAIDIIGLEGNVLSVNPAFEKMYGWTEKEIIGHPMPTIPKERYPDVFSQRAKVKSGESIKDLEVKCLTKSGEFIDVSITISPVLNENGEIIAFCGISRDITEKKKMELELRESKNRYKTLLNISPEAIYVQSNGIIQYINQAAVKMLGFNDYTEALGVRVIDFVHPDFKELAKERIRQTSIEGNTTQKTVEQKMLRADHSVFLAELTYIGILYEDKPAIQVICRDITENKMLVEKLIRSEEKYRLIAENMTDVVSIMDPSGVLIYSSPSYSSIIKIPPEEMIGTVAFNYVHPDDFRHIEVGFKEAFNQKGTKKFEHRLKHRTKCWIWVETTVTFFLDEQHGKPFLLLVSRDIDERKRLQDELKLMAFHDDLTGLPNRRLFHEKTDQVLKEAKRFNHTCALLFMDIDKFKWVNDHLGHVVGDELLKQFAKRVRACLRESDILARLGGDEFIILLPHIEHESDARLCAKRIMESLQQGWKIHEHVFQTTSSIGISFYPKDGLTIDKLMSNADKALYDAKNKGRNTISLYTKSN